MNQREAIEHEFICSSARASTYAAAVEILDRAISNLETNLEEAKTDLLSLRETFNKAKRWQEGVAQDAFSLMELDEELSR